MVCPSAVGAAQAYTGRFAFTFAAEVRAGICNLFRVQATARLLFVKDTVWSLTSTNVNTSRRDAQFNVHPRDGARIFMCLPTCEATGDVVYPGHDSNPGKTADVRQMADGH